MKAVQGNVSTEVVHKKNQHDVINVVKRENGVKRPCKIENDIGEDDIAKKKKKENAIPLPNSADAINLLAVVQLFILTECTRRQDIQAELKTM